MCEFVVDLGYLDDILDRSWDSGGLKPRGIDIPVFQTALMMKTSFSTGLKTRGYLFPRLSDALICSVRL